MSKGALKNGSRDHFNGGTAAQTIYVTAGVKVTISFRQKTCISLDNISPLFSEMISGRGIFFCITQDRLCDSLWIQKDVHL